MDVAILSMQKVDNYGSVLQAYALKKMIEKYNVNVDFMDIKRIEEDNILSNKYMEDYTYELEKNGKFSKLPKVDKFFFYRARNIIYAKAKAYYFERFRKTYLNIRTTREHYDLSIIGSDEVFNCLNTKDWGFTSQLFGNIPESDHVITYAASCGATRYEKVPELMRNRIKNTFEQIENFSVRDENTYSFVQKLSNKNISNNLDPVLIYDFDNEVDKIILKHLPERYCVVYAYDNRIHQKDEIDAIIKFCKKNNLVPITVGGGQFWCKKNIVCSPFECLAIFKNAKFVITDTFHGTIFSAKYAPRFAVIERESNKNKLGDLINRLGLNKHLVRELSIIGDMNEYCKDVEAFNSIINKERVKTSDYLASNILKYE